MIRCLQLLSGLLFLASSAIAGNGEGEYAVSRIPAALLKGATVIKRSEEYYFSITEGNRAVLKHRYAYTILNEQGDRWGYCAEGYDKLRSVEYMEGSLYDAEGKKIKSLKKAEIKDESGNSDANLADDNRVKWHHFFYKVYPYTVEYETEVWYKGTMFLPDWQPQEKPGMSVQQSRLQVKCPASNPLRYKMIRYNGEPQIREEKTDKIYTWEVRDIPAVDYEYAAPAWRKLSTGVYLATERFVLEDYEGSNASWKDFGKFVFDLTRNRDVLPDAVQKKVQELTAGVTDPREKIKRLYKFMQENSRYISIQLGVGGWQPFDAAFVSTKKYGDCKALSNYMYALLKAAGIRAVYTVTHRGDEEDYLLQELPSSQFNHAVLFVPLGKDTTWLECTSQTYMPGYMGGDNGNRLALAVDEQGGTLVRTPRYGYRENLQTRTIRASINDAGHMEAQIHTRYRAVQQDRLHHIINGLSKDKLMEFLKEDIELATYDIRNFKYEEEQEQSLPVIRETLDLVAEHYATVSGRRIFIVPNILSRSHRKPRPTEERVNELELGFGFTDRDTVEIKVPAGYTAEAIPPVTTLTTKFGRYQSEVKFDGETVRYIRSMEQYAGRYPAADYGDMVKFYETIYKSDRSKLVLVKKE